MRRGITPVVAIVLLLMMTVAASGGAYAWISSTTEQAQDEASRSLATHLDVRESRCAGTRAVVGIKNNGDRTLADDTVTAYLSADSDLVATREKNVSDAAVLQPGGFTTLYLSFTAVMDAGRTYTVEVRFPDSDAAVTATCDAGSTGLVNYWSFDEDDRDADTGPYHDLVQGNDAFLSDENTSNGDGDSPATLTTGIIGDALLHDGIDDATHLPITINDFDTREGPITLSAWVKPVTMPAETSVVVGDGWGWEIGFTANSVQQIYARTQGTYGATPVSTGEWYMLTITHDHGPDPSDLTDTTAKFYVNDTLQATVTRDVSSGSDYIEGTYYIGGDGGSPTIPDEFFNGVVDEVRIFDRPISERAVTELYEAGR